MSFTSLKAFLRFAVVPVLAAGSIAACSSSSDSDGAAGAGATGGSGGGGPSGTDLVVHGRVAEASSGGGQPSPLSGAEITAGVDRNNDGKLGADELTTASSEDTGNYSIAVGVNQGERVVVSFRYEGLAPQYRTVVAGPKGDATINITLAELKQLECTGGACAIEGNQLKIEGLPDGVTGSARVFNPVTQPEAFPGGFEESTGKLLISGVFSAVELTDDNGDPLHELAAPATLRMTMPMDTWGIVTDIQQGSDRIEVPLYAFDENLGTWVRDGEGYLEDATGAIIPESDLPSIRDGSFAGSVIATGEVAHFSYWNVDWPVESHGCVTGVILDANGNPAEGATVMLRGTTYNGTSSPFTVGPDGRFCVDVMRSEGAGEDVDQDGITGETQNVALRVSYGGNVYDLGGFDVGQAQATCAEGGCTDIGSLPLTVDKQLQIALCTLSGTVRDRAGNPIEGASVYAYDDTLESEMLAAVCGEYYENCTYFATTGPDGSYTVSTGMLDSLTLFGMLSEQVDDSLSRTRYGQRWLQRCPSGPQDLTLDEGYDSYTLGITVSGTQIAWEPNIPVDVLYVTDVAQSGYKWMISVEEGSLGFTGPLTYGTVPAGAIENFPYDGSDPVPMASGDSVQIISSGGTTADGYMIIATGSATVP